MSDLSRIQEEAIGEMMAQEFGRNPTGKWAYQSEAIRHAVSSDPCKRILMVQKTGLGKSSVVLGILRILGGVGINIVPLQSIGTGQAAAANEACRSMDSFHLDELASEERGKMSRQLDR